MSADPVLIVIDVQQGFRDALWGANGNPDALRNISSLVAHWRSKKLPIVVVKHNSKHPDSPLFPGSPGNELEPFLDGPRDVVIQKSVNSAFYGEPDLYSWLKANEIDSVAICGIQTNMCCETTARMAGNLGLDTWFVLDATHTFAKTANGIKISAEDLAQTTAVNLSGEFAQILSTEEAVSKIS